MTEIDQIQEKKTAASDSDQKPQKKERMSNTVVYFDDNDNIFYQDEVSDFENKIKKKKLFEYKLQTPHVYDLNQSSLQFLEN